MIQNITYIRDFSAVYTICITRQIRQGGQKLVDKPVRTCVAIYVCVPTAYLHTGKNSSRVRLVQGVSKHFFQCLIERHFKNEITMTN